MKPLVIVSAPIRSQSGYGKKAADFCRALLKLKADEWDIRLRITQWGGLAQSALSEDDPLLTHEITAEALDARVGAGEPVYATFHIGLPGEVFARGQYNYLVTSGVETTQFPPQWIYHINQLYDGVIVPSQFTKDMLMRSPYTTQHQTQESFCTKPVEIVCEGIDLKLFNPKNVTSAFSLGPIKENFVFLFVGMWLQGALGEDRKDVGRLVQLFSRAFRGYVNPPALVLKTNTGDYTLSDQDRILQAINRVQDFVRGEAPGLLPPVYLIHGELTDAQMVALYHHPRVKAMVSLTKGEAVGRPLLEFASMGKPVIAQAWSAPLEYLGEEHPLLSGEFRFVHPSAVMPGILETYMQWPTANETKTIETLRGVYKEYARVKPLAEQAAKRIRQDYSFKAMETQLATVLDKLVPRYTEITIPDYLLTHDESVLESLPL